MIFAPPQQLAPGFLVQQEAPDPPQEGQEHVRLHRGRQPGAPGRHPMRVPATSVPVDGAPLGKQWDATGLLGSGMAAIQAA